MRARTAALGNWLEVAVAGRVCDRDADLVALGEEEVAGLAAVNKKEGAGRTVLD